MENNNDIKKIVETIRKVPEVALFSHVSPDGDCLGSMLALGLALENNGKKVSYYNWDPIPANLRFLPGIEKINNSLDCNCPQTIILVDCAEISRVELDKKLLDSCYIINIDHHVSNDLFGDLNWVDSKASSTGEIIYALLKVLNVPINKEIATNLYTAIITDTGRFSYSNTTTKSFRIASELIKSGIDLVSINTKIFEQKSLSYIKLLYKALANLELLKNGKIAVITLSQEDFEQAGAEESLSEGLVNYARNIEDVEAAVLLKELDIRDIKVSFRSNNWLNVNQVAQRFGGGGHVRASGCTIKLPLAEAKEQIILVLEEALDNERND